MSVLSAARNVAREYVDKVLADEYSSALLNGMATVFDELVSTADDMRRAMFVLTAPEGAYATTTLELRPTTSLAAAVVVKAGSLFCDTKTTRLFATSADIEVGPGYTVGSVRATAIGRSAQYNSRGEYTAANGETVPGLVTVVHRLYTQPAFACDVTVRQTDDAVGGAFPSLEVQGHERGTYRAAGEPADVYRHRVHKVPDTVSPDAFERTMRATLTPKHIRYRLAEGWQEPTTYLDTEDDTAYCALDDYTRGPGGLGSVEFNTTTVLELDTTRPLSEMGAPMDDPSNNPIADNVFPAGEFYAAPCLDGDDESGRVTVVLDGEDSDVVGLYASLHDVMTGIKAGGTKVLVVGG